jgi:hypothetical protein
MTVLGDIACIGCDIKLERVLQETPVTFVALRSPCKDRIFVSVRVDELSRDLIIQVII